MGEPATRPWLRTVTMAAAWCLVLLGCHPCTGETELAFCSDGTRSSVPSGSAVQMFLQDEETQTECTCVVMDTTNLTRLAFRVQLAARSGTGRGAAERPNSTLTCQSFVGVHWGQRGGQRDGQLEQCAEPTSNTHTSSFLVMDVNDILVTIHNHHRRPLVARVTVTVEGGPVTVQCRTPQTSTPWTGDACPCDNLLPKAPPGGASDVYNRSDVSVSRIGLVVGVVCAAIFIAIVAIIARIIWLRKKNGGSGEKDLETVTAGNATDNAAFSPSTTASRSSGMDRPVASDARYANVPGPKYANTPGQGGPNTPGHGGPNTPGQGAPNMPGKGGPIPFDADPELDLSLQTSPHVKGSKDSGMYSMPADKPPNNNYPQYANIAPLGPDQMYNPMLAKQPSVASLTGQGALNGSMDHLNGPQPLYGKVAKKIDRKAPPPQRSASQDALNTNGPSRGDLVQARSRSHNASKSSMASAGSVVETDV